VRCGRHRRLRHHLRRRPVAPESAYIELQRWTDIGEPCSRNRGLLPVFPS
jgi:hypothetical protein